MEGVYNLSSTQSATKERTERMMTRILAGLKEIVARITTIVSVCFVLNVVCEKTGGSKIDCVEEHRVG